MKASRVSRLYCRLLLALAAMTLSVLPAEAELRVEFHHGTVTVVARDVSIQEILREWARVGGTEILRGEEMSAQPIAIELNAIPEADALGVILRSAAGHIALLRRSDVIEAGQSSYATVLILPASARMASSFSDPPPQPHDAPPIRTVIRGPAFGEGSQPVEKKDPNHRGTEPIRISPFGLTTSTPGMVDAPRQRRVLPPGPLPGAEPAFPEAPDLPERGDSGQADRAGASSPR